MPYVVTKDRFPNIQYLGFDNEGCHCWTKERLDGIRFESKKHAEDSCEIYLLMGANIQECSDDGHYEYYKNHEIQVFINPHNCKWYFRTTFISSNAKPKFSLLYGHASKGLALLAAKTKIDEKPLALLKVYCPR